VYAIFIFLIVHEFWAGHADLLLKCGSGPRCADQLAGLVYVSFTAFWKGKNSIVWQKYLNLILFLSTDKYHALHYNRIVKERSEKVISGK
jgi:hypothetical protein